ncbi:hypothetical protein JCM6882_000488 [Rhodosporidiobolus microsporus]
MPIHHLLVGTFNQPTIYTLAFDSEEETLEVVVVNEGRAPHSWLALNEAKDRLYATSWTEPPAVASYSISRPTSSYASEAPSVTHLSSLPTIARSGYVCVSPTHLYSAGGPTGEVYRLSEESGAIEEEVQKLDFVGDEGRQKDDGSTMDFGGLRHGSHSFDLSPDGKLAYVADIGRNAIFVFRVLPTGQLELAEKHISPRPTDGPRHVTPHPNGRYVYSLQEHSSMVDCFEVDQEKGTLKWTGGVKIIPEDHDPKDYWADEVRVSPSGRYLYCSTRHLTERSPTKKGWVAVYPLPPSGLLDPSSSPLALWETPTSGGWANAVEPAPGGYNTAREEFVALTDSEEGLVLILGWDGETVREVARTKLGDGAGAATAVWL